ncbi:hypothetical protein AHAS_Ahas18G0208700 [Arachis hypogaea]
MGISNTNYNSILHINVDLKEVKKFRQSIIMFGMPPAKRLSQLTVEPVYNLEDELINQFTYKSISELKDTIEGGNFATIDDVVAIDPKNGWYNINMIVADDTDTATFLLYDKEAVKYLGGGINKEYPTELNSLVGQNFLFKIFVKMENLNAFQPFKIIVAKLCWETSVLTKFLDKHHMHEAQSSELLSMQTDFVETHNIGTRSPSVKILATDDAFGKVVDGDNANANKTVEE